MLYIPSAVSSIMTVLKTKMSVPGLTLRATGIRMNLSPSPMEYGGSTNDRSSGEREGGREKEGGGGKEGREGGGRREGEGGK